jgi:hypothetical protein
MKLIAVILLLLISSCGSELCDEAAARCQSDCPAGSVLQQECSNAFEVSSEAACEAALQNFVCKTSTTT